jgi:hypothetical protein
MPLTSTRTLSVFRYAVYFDGERGYVRVAHSKFLVPSDEWTITGWFYYTGLSEFGSIVAKSPAPYHYVYWVYVSPEDRLCSAVYSSTFPVVTSTQILAKARWYHFAITWRYPGKEKMYINGVLDASAPAKKDNIDVTGDLIIGELRPGRRCLIRGYISMVQIYDKVLTDNEVMQNYRYPYNPVKDGLVLWFYAHPNYVKDIDGDGVLEWVDLSGYGNHGKIYGAQLVEFTKPKQPVRVLAKAR